MNFIKKALLKIFTIRLEKRYMKALKKLIILETKQNNTKPIQKELQDMHTKFLTIQERYKKKSYKIITKVAWDWGEYIENIEAYIFGCETGVFDIVMEEKEQKKKASIVEKFRKLTNK